MIAFLVQVGIAIAIWAINREMNKDYARKDGKPPPQGLSFPRINSGTPIPYIYGTVRTDSPMLIWKGNETIFDVAGGGVNIAYRRVDMLFSLGTPSWDSGLAPYFAWRNQHPPKLLSMWIGDVRYVFANGGLEHGQTELVQVNLGGRGAGGNFRATIEFFDGRDDQTLVGSTPFAAMQAANLGVTLDPDLVPGYRHQILVGVTMTPGANGITPGPGLNDGAGTLGEATSVQALSFEVESLGPQPVGQDANPAWVMYDLMCAPVWKAGRDPGTVDLTSFSSSANLYIEEENGFSLVFSEQTTAAEMLKVVGAQVDTIIFEDASGTTIKNKPVRGGYDVGGLLEMTQSNTIGRPKLRTIGWHNVATHMDAAFTNREKGYKPDSAPAGRLSNAVASAFQRSPRNVFYPGCTNRELAGILAARDLAVTSRPLVLCTARLSRAFYSVNPGDALLANWPDYNITNKVFRVLSLDYGQLADGTITATLIEDIFDQTAGAFPDETPDVIPPFLLPVHERLLTETPYWMQLDLYTVGTLNAPDIQRLLYIAANPDDANATTFSGDTENLIVPGATYTDAPGGGAWRRYGSVAVAYPRTAEPYDITTGLVLEDCGAAMKSALDDLSLVFVAGEVPYGGQLCVLFDSTGDHEFVAFETTTDIGSDQRRLNRVWRGLLDTAARDWPVGTRLVWLDYQFQAHVGRVGRTVGIEVESQFIPSGGLLTGSGDDPIDTLVIQGRSAQPLPCADFGVAGPRLTGTTGDPATAYLKLVSDLDADFRFEAAPRAKSAATITRGDAGYHSIESGNTFDLIAEKQNEGEDPETEVTIAAGLTSTLSGGYLLGKAGHGEIDLKLRTKNGSLSSWTDPTIRVSAPSWRNLLANPAATNTFGVASVTGWDNVTGTVQASTGTSSLSRSASGNYFTSATASSNVTAFRQTVDVSGYPARGLSAIVDFYYRNLAADANDTITVLVEALDAASGSLSSSATSGALVGDVTLWKRATVTIAAMPALTAKVRVTVTLTSVSDAAPSTALSEISLRLGQVGSQLLGNPTFDDVAITYTFDAVPVAPATADEGDLPFEFTASVTVGGGTQTNAEFTMHVFHNDGAGILVGPTNVNLDGWSASAWTVADGGRTYYATFTKASVTVGTHTLTFSIAASGGVGNTVNFFTNHVSHNVPNTDQAAGAGALDLCTLT